LLADSSPAFRALIVHQLRIVTDENVSALRPGVLLATFIGARFFFGPILARWYSSSSSSPSASPSLAAVPGPVLPRHVLYAPGASPRSS